MLETELKKNTAALEALTAAITANGCGGGSAPAAAADGKKEEKKDTPKKPAAGKGKGKGVTKDDVREGVGKTRAELRKEHGAGAVSKHKEAWRGILEDMGHDDLDAVPDDEVKTLWERVQAINVIDEEGGDNDDL